MITRLAVTPGRIRRYSLPTVPQKRSDRRGAHMPATVQAEAPAPDQLTGILTTALDRLVDQQAFRASREQSARERRTPAGLDRTRLTPHPGCCVSARRAERTARRLVPLITWAG